MNFSLNSRGSTTGDFCIRVNRIGLQEEFKGAEEEFKGDLGARPKCCGDDQFD